MAGKMSVGVLVRTKGVIKSTSKAATTNVYGRRRARRTIHITCLRCGYGHTSSPSWLNSRSETYKPPWLHPREFSQYEPMANSFETTPDRVKCQCPFTSMPAFSSDSAGRVFFPNPMAPANPGVLTRVMANATLWILHDHPKERGRIPASALDN